MKVLCLRSRSLDLLRRKHRMNPTVADIMDTSISASTTTTIPMTKTFPPFSGSVGSPRSVVVGVGEVCPGRMVSP